MAKVWYCDFETSPKEYSTTETHMCVWGVTDNQHNFTWGIDWWKFMNKMVSHKSNMAIAYFQNLSFDGEFIIHWLNRNGWTQQIEVEWEAYSWKVIQKYGEKINHKKYTLIYTELGKLMSIKVNYKGKTIDFRDGMLIFPVSVKRINELVALEHGIELKKGSYDFKKIRPYKYESDVPQDLIEYLRNDVRGMPYIFTDFQKELRNLTTKGKLKLTIGATTKAVYQDVIESWKTYFEGFSEQMDAEIRQAYYGGLTLVNPRHQNKILESDIYKYDINSSYPHQMRNNLMPYGNANIIDDIDFELFTPKPNHRYLIKVSITKCKKIDKFMPSHLWDLDKRTRKNEKYMDDFEIPVGQDGIIYIIAYEEFLEILKTYDLEYMTLRIYEFRAKKGIFDKVIDTFFEQKVNNKREGKELKKEIYKLFINNGYGKFGESNVKFSRIQIPINELNKLTEEQERMTAQFSRKVDYGNPNYIWTRGRSETKMVSYLPVAIFTTSDARVQLLQAIRKQTREADNFIYCDTDSIVIFGKAKDMELDNYQIGKWDLEAHITKFSVIKPKCYMYDSEQVTYKRISGFPEKDRGVITWDNFYSGSVFEGVKLQKHRVAGGILLLPTKITL